MNVGCPHAGCKEQQLKGEEVHGHKEQQPTVGYRLQPHVQFRSAAKAYLTHTI